MTPEDIVRQVQDTCSEWTEMSSNPNEIIIGVLAHKMANLVDYVEYLERRLKDVNKANSCK